MELIIFTAGVYQYADWVLDQIDPDFYISHRLYRHHCTKIGEKYVKDLSKIGRDITKTIIVDNLTDSFKL